MNVGWLSALTMVLALVADLVILRPVITFLRVWAARAGESPHLARRT